VVINSSNKLALRARTNIIAVYNIVLFLHRTETLCQAGTEIKSFYHHQCSEPLLPRWTR